VKWAVSNIAWPPEKAQDAYALLARFGVRGLEIAPSLFFAGADDPFTPTRAEAAQALAPMQEAGLELVSMQSLLFGVSGAALFGDDDERARLEAAVRRAINLAGQFGIPNLVFGSPRQRIVPDGMAPVVAADIAVAMFRRLGDAAAASGCLLAIEANPAEYGTNFLTHTQDALAFVDIVDHPAISLNLDLGAVWVNGEKHVIGDTLANAAGRVSHVHISEPNLAPAPADGPGTRAILSIVDAAGYDAWYSIEMKAVSNFPLDAVEAGLIRLGGA